MRAALGLLFALMMVGAQGAPKAKPTSKAKPDPIEQAHARVRDVMKDPESARFKDDFMGKDGAVCGFVNAKNSYGGYGGFRRYIVWSDRTMIESSDADEGWKIDVRWQESCSESESATP